MVHQSYLYSIKVRVKIIQFNKCFSQKKSHYLERILYKYIIIFKKIDLFEVFIVAINYYIIL